MKWRIENSWSEAGGDKGATKAWFLDRIFDKHRPSLHPSFRRFHSHLFSTRRTSFRQRKVRTGGWEGALVCKGVIKTMFRMNRKYFCGKVFSKCNDDKKFNYKVIVKFNIDFYIYHSTRTYGAVPPLPSLPPPPCAVDLSTNRKRTLEMSAAY